MKNKILLLSLLAFVTACDAPQRTRAPQTYVTGNNVENPSNSSGNFQPSTTGSAGGGSTTGSTSGGSGPGFESCNISADTYQTVDIGFFNVCQSTQTETLFKFRTSLTSTSVRICLIPTYKESNGSSTYIGQPQCTYTTAGQVVSGQLVKDRPGFTSYPLNGVIVMKEPLLPEYFACMQGYVNWPANVCQSGSSPSYCSYWQPRCPYGARSNASCDAEARNYMASICNSFKSRYGNSYSDIRTRQ